MIKEYGKEKGTSIFYASINEKKAGSEKWHKASGKYDKEVVKNAREKLNK
jgi:hypothetical protein